MRNPTTLYDRNLAQEEPLRSFFRDQACDNTNNKRNEFAILLRLKHVCVPVLLMSPHLHN